MTTEALKDDVKVLSDTYSADVDSTEIYDEMCRLKQIHKANIDPKGDIVKPLDLLNRVTNFKLTGLFPNVCVALHIFLTVATGER